jgi:hypothetical protein
LILTSVSFPFSLSLQAVSKDRSYVIISHIFDIESLFANFRFYCSLLIIVSANSAIVNKYN